MLTGQVSKRERVCARDRDSESTGARRAARAHSGTLSFIRIVEKPGADERGKVTDREPQKTGDKERETETGRG